MQIRQILGYLYLVFAILLAFAAIGFLSTYLHNARMAENPVLTATEYFGLAIVGAVTGVVLLRSKSRHWSWLALFVGFLGLWKFSIAPFLSHPFVSSVPFIFVRGPLWLSAMRLAGHFLIPIIFVLSIILLFKKPDTIPETNTEVKRGSPIFGISSLAIPVIAFLIGSMMALTPSEGEDGWGKIVGIAIVACISLLLAFLSIAIAFIRWEKYLIFPLLGFIICVSPFLFISRGLGGLPIANAIFGILFCTICTILALTAKERGKNWALLAAIPPIFAFYLMVLPIITAAVREIHVRSIAAKASAERAHYTDEIERDPGIALKDRWDLANDSRRDIFNQSFANPKIHYSDSLLEGIYTNCPGMRNNVFYYPGCGIEISTNHFDEAYALGRKGDCTMLNEIIEHTNTPIELVQKVATAKDLPVRAIKRANTELEKRGENLPPTK